MSMIGAVMNARHHGRNCRAVARLTSSCCCRHELGGSAPFALQLALRASRVVRQQNSEPLGSPSGRELKTWQWRREAVR
jgi:hypothetical protein